MARSTDDPYDIDYDQSPQASDPFAEQLTALYAKYGRGAPTLGEIQSHRGNPGGLAAVEEILKADNAKGNPPATTTTTSTTGGGNGGGGQTGLGYDGGSIYKGGVPTLTDFWDTPFTKPPLVDLGGPKDIPYIPPTPPAYDPPKLPPAPTPPPAPTFTAPTPPPAPTPNLPGYTAPPAFSYADYPAPGKFSYSDFKAPTPEEALNDPGYQFRVQQGAQALDRSAAARGVLNTGGTLKNAVDYGQNAASQEYQNVWNRDYSAYGANRSNALDTFNLNEGNRFNTYMANRGNALNTYNTNYQTQYKDPYDISYQRATDTYKPQLEGWRAGIDTSLAGFNANVNSGLAGYGAKNAAELAGYSANVGNITTTAAQNHQTALAGYQTQAAAGQHQNDMNYLNDWNLHNFDYNKVRNYQTDLWNRMYGYAQL